MTYIASSPVPHADVTPAWQAPAAGDPPSHAPIPRGRALLTLHPQDLRLLVVGLGLVLRQADEGRDARDRIRRLARTLFDHLPPSERGWVTGQLRVTTADARHEVAALAGEPTTSTIPDPDADQGVVP